MYRILRNFSIASLISIVLAALLLALFYRHEAIKGIEYITERSNVEVAQTALRPVNSRLVKYLASVAHIDKPGAVIGPLDARLEKTIEDLMTADDNVVLIKIYNRHGIVVFSTKTSQIGQDQREISSNDKYENAGFKSAINGRIASRLIYHDAFNLFKQTTEADNLTQTYIPVRRTVTAPIQGVFEIYTDVRPLVDYAQYTQIAIAGVMLIILTLLYLTLLVIVRRAEKIIASQQTTIRERTETLELLSAQLLTAQENERKRLASELNEDVAQTLSALKFQVEHACQVAREQSTEENTRSLASIITTIQNAIQKVSAMAMDLRPPSLDDLGVVATINWFIRKFQSLHPEIKVELQTEIDEDKVSRALRIIIYRIIQETLENLATYALTNFIRIRLDRTEDIIALTIEDDGGMHKSNDVNSWKKDDKRIWLHAIEERALLSGGTVFIENKASGGYRKRFTWPSQEVT